MSVDYTAVIARGFLIDENPYEDDRFADSFIDDWVIYFDAWDSCGPFLIGYYIQQCEAGCPYAVSDPICNNDDLLIAACEDAGLPIGEIKTYFGVRVS